MAWPGRANLVISATEPNSCSQRILACLPKLLVWAMLRHMLISSRTGNYHLSIEMAQEAPAQSTSRL